MTNEACLSAVIPAIPDVLPYSNEPMSLPSTVAKPLISVAGMSSLSNPSIPEVLERPLLMRILDSSVIGK